MAILRNPVKNKHHIELSTIYGVWFFVLFLFAGNYKADPFLAHIQQKIDLTLLFFLLSFLSFLYYWFKKRLHMTVPYIFGPISFLFFLLATILLSGTLLNGSTGYGFQKAVRFIILTGWAFIGPPLLIRDSEAFRHFAWALTIIAFIMALDALTRYFVMKQVFFLTAFGSTYIALGRDAGLGLLTSMLFLLPIVRKPIIYFFLWIMMAFQFWAMLRAGARGPVFALIFSLLIFFVISVHGNFLHFKIDSFAWRLSVLVLLVSIILLLVAWKFFPTLMNRTELLWSGGGLSVMRRVDFYRMALAQWMKSPLWGIGTGQFSVAVIGIEGRLYPHDIILELASENGIIGVLAFLSMIGLAFREGWQCLHIKNVFHRIVGKYLLVVTTFALFNAMVSGDINDNRILFTFIGMLTLSNPLANLFVNKNREFIKK